MKDPPKRYQIQIKEHQMDTENEKIIDTAEPESPPTEDVAEDVCDTVDEETEASEEKKRGRVASFFRGIIKSPYFYLNIIASVSVIFYAWAMSADDESETLLVKTNESEQKNSASIQAVLALVIFGGCIAGYYITKNIRASLPDIEDIDTY